MSGGFDPLVPRQLDLPTDLPLDIDLSVDANGEVFDDVKIFAAPTDPALLPRWREQLAAWRRGALARHGVPQRYDDPAAEWSSRCYSLAQVWLWDELFYDAATGSFTPDRFLEDARQRFGGLDGVVLWHAYPVIGIDDRNQWDFYDVDGLPEAAAELRAAGVRVFVNYNPWDTGTRRAGTDVDELASVVTRLGADGIFLDTLRNADPAFVAALDKARPGIGLEGESKLSTARIADHALSWAQWFADSPSPGVPRAHLFERRHMQHHIRRWHRDHGEELRSAWVNGIGIMVWEVVFGAWVGWNARDSATLRRMLPVQRALHRWLTDGEWTPLAVTTADGVVGSTFELDGVVLTTLANAGDAESTYLPEGDGQWLALHEGLGLIGTPPTVAVPAQGIAAVLQVRPGASVPEGVAELVAELARHPHEADASFPHRRAVRVTAPAWGDVPAPAEVGAQGRGSAVEVASGEHVITVRYRMRETGMYDGAPYVNEWKPLPPRLHDSRTLERVVELEQPLLVGAREVSELEFAEFLRATGQAAPESASSERPATRVTLAAARSYAAWVGGRLPTEDEWQLAASRPGFERRRPAVWNWTESEHVDGRTRFVMLKGGSDHLSEGSDWYFDGGITDAEFSAKLLLPGKGVDASSSIGFRVCWVKR